jgi:hypothetical protein
MSVERAEADGSWLEADGWTLMARADPAQLSSYNMSVNY